MQVMSHSVVTDVSLRPRIELTYLLLLISADALSPVNKSLPEHIQSQVQVPAANPGA
jgi:hypothetical protein